MFIQFDLVSFDTSMCKYIVNSLRLEFRDSTKAHSMGSAVSGCFRLMYFQDQLKFIEPLLLLSMK